VSLANDVLAANKAVGSNSVATNDEAEDLLRRQCGASTPGDLLIETRLGAQFGIPILPLIRFNVLPHRWRREL